MTKEECLQALEAIGDWSLWDSDRTESGMWKVKDASRKEYELIEKLITEHFDNPSLSFDDLKEGMWVWDDKHSFYDQIISLGSSTPSSIETETWFTSFEETRFYRRQKEEQQ